MSKSDNPQRVGLIGWPVEHSISPVMLNAAFDALDLNWRYDLYPISPDQFDQGIADLRAMGIRGFNITIPHKQTIIDHVDSLQQETQVIGAVNTVVAHQLDTGIRWEGTNTDCSGFLKDLIACIGDPQPQQRAIILGAGGAARSAVFMLARLNYQIVLVCRDSNKGLQLIRDIQRGLYGNRSADAVVTTQMRMQMRTIPWANLAQISGSVDLIVNCTPVGMWPNVDASPWPDDIPLPVGATIYDMIYRPEQTRLMQQANAAGLPAYNGLGMLVQQGAAAFEIWTGQQAPLAVMQQAAKRALQL